MVEPFFSACTVWKTVYRGDHNNNNFDLTTNFYILYTFGQKLHFLFLYSCHKVEVRIQSLAVVLIKLSIRLRVCTLNSCKSSTEPNKEMDMAWIIGCLDFNESGIEVKPGSSHLGTLGTFNSLLS